MYSEDAVATSPCIAPDLQLRLALFLQLKVISGPEEAVLHLGGEIAAKP